MRFRPWAGCRWHCDEVRFLIFGSEAFLFAVMDYSTRFVLSGMISPKKSGVKPLGMFKNAAERSGVVQWVFVTDGLPDFIKPVRKAFWRRIGRRLVHVVEIHAQNEFNHNDVQECLNGTLKPLLRIRGGFKVDNSPLVGLIILCYNFFRPHTALDHKTPAEAADIHVAGPDKVLTLLQAAAA